MSAASRVGKICEQLAAFLNTQPFATPFLAQRANQKIARQEKYAGRPVGFVYPLSMTIMPMTRDLWSYQHQVVVTLAQMLVQGTIEEEDALVALAEQVPFAVTDFAPNGAELMQINDDAQRTVFHELELEEGFFFMAQIVLNYLDDPTGGL